MHLLAAVLLAAPISACTTSLPARLSVSPVPKVALGALAAAAATGWTAQKDVHREVDRRMRRGRFTRVEQIGSGDGGWQFESHWILERHENKETMTVACGSFEARNWRALVVYEAKRQGGHTELTATSRRYCKQRHAKPPWISNDERLSYAERRFGGDLCRVLPDRLDIKCARRETLVRPAGTRVDQRGDGGKRYTDRDWRWKLPAEAVTESLEACIVSVPRPGLPAAELYGHTSGTWPPCRSALFFASPGERPVECTNYSGAFDWSTVRFLEPTAFPAGLSP